MKLTDEQLEWLMGMKLAAATKPSVDMKRRCGTCRYMVRHPYTAKINYCSKGTSKHTGSYARGMASTKRNHVCALWEGKDDRKITANTTDPL